MEIRSGAGGDEAALFAAEIYRMYVHYAESRRWKIETMELEEIGIEMEKVDNEDEQLYFNTDGKKPAALKEELDQNKATFDKFKEQVDAFADFVIAQANSSQEN